MPIPSGVKDAGCTPASPLDVILTSPDDTIPDPCHNRSARYGAETRMTWPPGDTDMARRFRDHDWSATPLGPASAWPDRLRALVEHVLASPAIATIALGPDRLLLYNDAAAALYGARHPAALGRPLADTFADGYRTVAPLYDRVFAGEAITVHAQPLAVDPARTDQLFDAYLTPVRDAAGAVVGVHMTGLELGDLARAAAAQQASEERHAFLLALGDAMRAAADPDAVVATASRLLGERLAASRVVFAEIDEPAGIAHIRQGWVADGAEAHPVELRLADFDGPLLADLRAGRATRFDDVGEAPYPRPDLAALAAIGVRAGLSVPLLVGGAFVFNVNVHQHAPRRWTDDEIALVAEVADRLWAALRHARAQADLRRSEARLAAIFDSIPAGLSVSDPSGDVVLMNAAMHVYLPDARMPSRSPDRVARWYGEDAEGRRIPATDYPGARSLRGEHVAGLEMRYTDDDGGERWTSVSSAPIRDPAGAITGQVTAITDIDDLRRLQQRQQFLVAELQHRVRNILSVVRSVFGRTVEAGGTLDDVVDHFRGRLDALARTQVIVTRSDTGLVDLENLVRDELLAVGASDGDLVSIDGPEVLLPPVAAEPIGLAIHELATNALKYGALRIPGATLGIRWQTNIDYGGRRHLHLNWTEQGVPAIPVAPARRGFGSELIEEGLPYRLGGDTRLEFRGGGVACSLSIPLPDPPGPATVP